MTPVIFEALQRSLSAHWTAIENYATQAEHFRRNGFPKLADAAGADATEEREHAAKIMARLEYFDQQPLVTHDVSIWPRLPDFQAILAHNWALETAAADIERAGILACRVAGDEGTADVLSENLAGSEEAIQAITAAQRVIQTIGLDNYLANYA